MSQALRMTLADDYEAGMRAIYESPRPLVVAHCWACRARFIASTQEQAIEELTAHLDERHPHQGAA